MRAEVAQMRYRQRANTPESLTSILPSSVQLVVEQREGRRITPLADIQRFLGEAFFALSRIIVLAFRGPLA
jgi:hypothetical protein